MKLLTIQVEEGGRVAKKVFPLEPFQLMSPKVAAEGFLITVRRLQAELDKPVPPLDQSQVQMQIPPNPLSAEEKWRKAQAPGPRGPRKKPDAAA